MGCGSSNAVSTVNTNSPTGTNLKALQKKYPSIGDKVIKSLYNNFMDICPDGHMRKAEFQRFYSIVNKSPDNAALAEFCGNLFMAFDDDRSGTMEFSEFINMLFVMTDGSMLELLTAVFNLCDLDKSGTIEKNELVQTLKTLSMLSTDDKAEKQKELTALAEKIFDTIDSDGDGHMTFTEFADGFMENEDGKTLVRMIYSTMITVLIGNVKDK